MKNITDKRPGVYSKLGLTSISVSTLLLLGGCIEGIDTDNTSSSGSTISGFYTKAPVTGASCQLIAVNDPTDSTDDIAVSEPQLTDGGEITFADITYEGDVYMACQGGSYVDEATGLVVELKEMTMRSSIDETVDSMKFTATPLTELAYRRAESDGDLNDIDEHLTDVADDFGIPGVDIGTGEPTPIECLGTEELDESCSNETNDDSTTSDSDDDLYGTVLAAVSQMMLDAEPGLPPTATALNNLLEKLEERIESDSPSAKGIANALLNMTHNPQTNSRIKDTDTSEIIARVGKGKGHKKDKDSAHSDDSEDSSETGDEQDEYDEDNSTLNDNEPDEHTEDDSELNEEQEQDETNDSGNYNATAAGNASQSALDHANSNSALFDKSDENDSSDGDDSDTTSDDEGSSDDDSTTTTE